MRVLRGKHDAADVHEDAHGVDDDANEEDEEEDDDGYDSRYSSKEPLN